MCDTILAMPAASAGNIMLFGKNSDRQRNEAQPVEYKPRADHAPGTQLKCTYISIPQAAVTHAVVLSSPFWIWGAEMGANEHGVVIGNEGQRARVPAPEEPALIGMDLLRLGLERGATAAEALDVITSLLERYGQGGNCGHLTPAFYHNSFMIADANEAYVLETAGREWVAERVRTVRAISNDYSVEDVARASQGLCREHVTSDPQVAHIGSAKGRRVRATSLLAAAEKTLTVANIMSILRDHVPNGEPDWDPRTAKTLSLCIHAAGEDRNAQTTGSMASEIGRNRVVHWFTGTSAPCVSIFKPVLFDAPLPDHGPRPTDRFDAATLWWRHERMHRAALLGDFPKFIREISEERDAVEASFRKRVDQVLNGGNRADRAKVVADCWKEALEVEDRWLARTSAAYLNAWHEMNRIAGVA